jgi:hypothetical protein
MVLRNRWFLLLLAGCCLAATLLSTMLVRSYLQLGAPIRSLASETDDQLPEEPDAWESFEVPGVSFPPMTAASDSSLGDTVQVIGVVVNAEARAYLVSAMGIPPEAVSEQAPNIEHYMRLHVVNDLIGGCPVSVTYCDVSRCVRVLTTANRHEPLELKIGGKRENDLLLFYEGQRYVQSDQQLPLADVVFTVTSWGEWKRLHPRSLLYCGPI